MNIGRLAMGGILFALAAAPACLAQQTSSGASTQASRPATTQTATAIVAPRAASQAATAVSATPARIAELIRNLGSDDLKARQGAHEELSRIGAAAKDALLKAAESSDPEVKGRAQELLSDIAANEALARSQAVARMLLWSAPIKAGVVGSPVKAGSTILTFNDEAVYAIDAATGKEAWKFESKADWRLAVSGTTVAIGQDDKINGVDIDTGKLQWKQEPPGGNRPVVMASDDAAIYVNNSAGLLAAMSPDDGNVTWKAKTIISVKPMIVAGKTILLAGNLNDAMYANRPTQVSDQVVTAMDAGSGKKLWRYEADSPFVSMSAGKDAVYLFRQQDLLAVDMKSGELLWTYKLPETRDPGYFRMYVKEQQVSPDIGQCRPIVSGDKVCLLLGRSIVGINAKTGQQAFRHMLTDLFGPDEMNWWNKGTIYRPDGSVRSGAAGYLAVEGDFACLQRNTFLAGIDLKQGKVLWSLDLGGTFTGLPLLADGVLYFGIQPPEKIFGASDTADKSKSTESLKLEPGLHALKLRTE